MIYSRLKFSTASPSVHQSVAIKGGGSALFLLRVLNELLIDESSFVVVSILQVIFAFSPQDGVQL